LTTKIEKLKNMIIILFFLLLSTTVSAQKPTVEWANIPAGTYTMGSLATEIDRNDDEPQHLVTLSAFKMSKYEVTIAQFEAFIDATGYITDAEKGTEGPRGSDIWNGSEFEFKADVNWKCDEKGNLRPTSEYNHPVVHVSWIDAKAFAEWMGCRLPTEAEWEYACRAGTTTPFYTGNNLMTSQANFNGNQPYGNNGKGEYRGKILPVGSFSSNPWGLYDMYGNVREWCNDRYNVYQTDSQTNPVGPASGTDRIFRGCCWGCSTQACRSAHRYYGETTRRDSGLGIRLVSAM
jgi:sulfatase modifying factor 1